jgi:hypothetical protein
MPQGRFHIISSQLFGRKMSVTRTCDHSLIFLYNLALGIFLGVWCELYAYGKARPERRNECSADRSEESGGAHPSGSIEQAAVL